MTSADKAAVAAVSFDSTTKPGTTYLALTYRRNPLLSGSTVNFQTSGDLATWTTVVSPDISKQIGTDLATGDPIMEVGVIATGAKKQFVRLNVTTP